MTTFSIGLFIIYLVVFILSITASVFLSIFGIKIIKKKRDYDDVFIGSIVLFAVCLLFLISIILFILPFMEFFKY